MNIKKEELKATLEKHNIEPNVINAVIQDLDNNTQIAEQKEKSTYRFAAIAIKTSDGLGIDETPLYICKLKDDETHEDIIPNIKNAINYHNANVATKNKREPIETITGAFNNISKKIFKESGLRISSYEPIVIVLTDNNI